MNKHQCIKTKEQKISCLLFSCPLIEEIDRCSLSSFRLITSNQKFWVDEEIETGSLSRILKVNYLCIKHRT